MISPRKRLTVPRSLLRVLEEREWEICECAQLRSDAMVLTVYRECGACVLGLPKTCECETLSIYLGPPGWQPLEAVEGSILLPWSGGLGNLGEKGLTALVEKLS